jgi:hypothetical protein
VSTFRSSRQVSLLKLNNWLAQPLYDTLAREAQQ